MIENRQWTLRLAVASVTRFKLHSETCLQLELKHVSPLYLQTRCGYDSSAAESKEAPPLVAVNASVQVTPFLRSGWLVGHLNG